MGTPLTVPRAPKGCGGAIRSSREDDPARSKASGRFSRGSVDGQSQGDLTGGRFPGRLIQGPYRNLSDQDAQLDFDSSADDLAPALL